MLITQICNRKDAEPRIHAWTKDEYYRMGDIGLFDGRRVEFIEGMVIEMSPMLGPHATAGTLVEGAVGGLFGKGFFMRVDKPLDLGEGSEPEPDVAIVQGHPRDFVQNHPTSAVLIVEVSDTSLEFDRAEKASLYAKAGVPDLWILNLNERRLEVCRDPQYDPSQPFGFGYGTRVIVEETDSISPLATPEASVKVADMLP